MFKSRSDFSVSWILVAVFVPKAVAESVFPLHSIGTNLAVSQDLKEWLEHVALRTKGMFRGHAVKSTTSLHYSIFQGTSRSVLRDIPPLSKWSTRLPSLVISDKLLVATSMLLCMYVPPSMSLDVHHLDAAHEVLLGVTHDNLSEAEYAASHRLQTSWSKEHPLSDEDDLLHSILHRMEGSAIGEGGFSGWDNAKYWIAGGPKHTECLVNDSQPRQHEIISAGGETRWVTVEAGSWDPIAWIDLCRNQADKNNPSGLTDQDILELQVAELCLLVRWQLIQLLQCSETTKLWPSH